MMTKEEMSKSIAFSADLINQLNEVAKSLDPRLYFFAYYEPKIMPLNDGYRLCFYVALINLYGLFWDCGPFVRTRLMTFSSKNSNQGILPRINDHVYPKCQLTVEGKNIKNRFNTLIDDISSVRSVFCHNNSQMLYLNSIHYDNQKKWFESVLSKTIDETLIGQTEWEHLLVSLIERTNIVIQDIFYCLDWLSKIKLSNPGYFTMVVDDWLLKGIGYWYQEQKDLIINILADFYYYYLCGDISYAISIREYNRYISFKANLQRWLSTNFGENARFGEVWLDSSNVRNILVDIKNCPCPALPIELLSELTNDVKNFARSNRIK